MNRDKEIWAVFGGGGHTYEMKQILKGSNIDAFCLGKKDVLFIPEKQFSLLFQNRNLFFRCLGILYGCISSFLFLLSTRKWPLFLLCNGPGISVSIVFSFYIASFCLWKKRPIFIFVESATRVEKFSRSGCILYYFVDFFIMQWEIKNGQRLYCGFL